MRGARSRERDPVSFLDPDASLALVVIWSLVYATYIGPRLQMSRLLKLLPVHGAELVLALVDGIDDLAPRERKEVSEAIHGLVQGFLPEGMGGGMPLKRMKWWEVLAFRWGILKQSQAARREGLTEAPEAPQGAPPAAQRGPAAARGRQPQGDSREARRSGLVGAFRR